MVEVPRADGRFATCGAGSYRPLSVSDTYFHPVRNVVKRSVLVRIQRRASSIRLSDHPVSFCIILLAMKPQYLQQG